MWGGLSLPLLQLQCSIIISCPVPSFAEKKTPLRSDVVDKFDRRQVSSLSSPTDLTRAPSIIISSCSLSIFSFRSPNVAIALALLGQHRKTGMYSKIMHNFSLFDFNTKLGDLQWSLCTNWWIFENFQWNICFYVQNIFANRTTLFNSRIGDVFMVLPHFGPTRPTRPAAVKGKLRTDCNPPRSTRRKLIQAPLVGAGFII